MLLTTSSLTVLPGRRHSWSILWPFTHVQRGWGSQKYELRVLGVYFGFSQYYISLITVGWLCRQRILQFANTYIFIFIEGPIPWPNHAHPRKPWGSLCVPSVASPFLTNRWQGLWILWRVHQTIWRWKHLAKLLWSFWFDASRCCMHCFFALPDK